MTFGNDTLLVILGYFIVIVVVLTIMWRIVLALDLIARHLKDISENMRERPAPRNETIEK